MLNLSNNYFESKSVPITPQALEPNRIVKRNIQLAHHTIHFIVRKSNYSQPRSNEVPLRDRSYPVGCLPCCRHLRLPAAGPVGGTPSASREWSRSGAGKRGPAAPRHIPGAAVPPATERADGELAGNVGHFATTFCHCRRCCSFRSVWRFGW